MKKLPNPVERRIIVQFLPSAQSGLVLPDAALPIDGGVKVLKIGPAVTYCKPGDFILLFPDAQGAVILDPKKKIALIHESNIMAVEESE